MEPGFEAEPFGPSQQRSMVQTLRKKAMRVIPLIRRRLASLSPAAGVSPVHVVAREPRGPAVVRVPVTDSSMGIGQSIT